MINDPSVDALIKKLGENSENGEPVSKYALCTVVSKRARQIIERDRTSGSLAEVRDKEVVRACRDIMDGKITFTKD